MAETTARPPLRLAQHRYGFHVLLCVTRGECTHFVDFEPLACKAGALLAIQAAQTQRFGPDRQWDGWIVMFRPEFLAFANTTTADSTLGLAVKYVIDTLETLGAPKGSKLHVEAESREVLDGRGRVLSFWQRPRETAFYVYGTSYLDMGARLTGFVRSYPLCERCRVVQIA